MPSPVTVRLKRLSARAVIPQYHSDQAAGMDLAACIEAPVTIAPGQIVKIPLGFAVALPIGYEAQIRPRSGLATKHGVTVPNSPGTVDSDYRGEMVVALINLGREPFTVEPGTRVAQMIVAPVSHATIMEVEELDATSRGTGGFGSTGVS
jgi:dUTP pyrophosphatase